MKSICTALAEAFAEFEGASKSKPNPAFRSKYADLSAVIDAIKPALVKHALFFNQETHEAEGGVTVETVIRHASGEEIRCGKLFVPANKKDAHGHGSALTYARRYSLMAAFGIPAEDDDGNAAARTAPRADPVPAARSAMATGEQRDLIATLVAPAGKTIQNICEAYDVSSLDELTSAKADAVIKRLRDLAAAGAK